MPPYLWLALLLLAIAFLLRVDFVFYILYVLAGVFLWSRWHAARALTHLVASRAYRRRAFLGEQVEVTVTLENKSRLALPWVQFQESVPPELRLEESTQHVVSLAGRGQRSHVYHVKGLQRGYYRLGPLRLTSGDLFGLAKSRVGYLPSDFLTVYPRIVPVSRLGLPSRLPFGAIASQQRLFEDPARPMGTRDFRSGDPLRQINWKASAHTQKLLVRTFQPAISLETMILLDLHASDYERRDRLYWTEWAIVTAASIATHLVNQRQAVGLMSNGVDPLRIQEDAREFDEVTGRLLFQTLVGESARSYLPTPIPPGDGRSHLMKVLEQLARLDTRDTIPLSEWASTAGVRLSWGVTILAITGQGDEPRCNALHRLARAGFNPILIAVEPDANFGLVRERARRLGFRAYNLTSRADLDRIARPEVGRPAGATP
ncbi:MAG TPA: DUF58 domain-containing protein [Promineifilum sp.]|nr:DUF58 domain-containing protein [Promineifilum sp.]